MGAHRHAVPTINHRDDFSLMEQLHQLAEVDGLKLEPNPRNTVLGEYVSVISVDGTSRNCDVVCGAFFPVGGLDRKPRISHIPTIHDRDDAVVGRLQSL